MQKSQIIEILEKIERTENIKILYACEAGSRVWGFSRKDSDYDIRLIYKKADVGDYLALKSPREVIEYRGDDIDIVGWDIKKALNLHIKDNPTLREMLISDMVYIDLGIHDIFDDLDAFNNDVLKNHYSSMALKHWRKYCGLEFEKTKTKKISLCHKVNSFMETP